jgi:hypothetical protein
MVEVKATNTRKKFMCSPKDRIMDNGRCYQLITQTFIKDWSNVCPVISKKEFERLLKMDVFKEPHIQKRMIGEVKLYDFKENV